MSSQAPGHFTILARNIRLARDRAELTQRQLGARVDTDSALVSKWERGWHRPDHGNMEALCRELNVTMAWLYTEHPDVDYGDDTEHAGDQAAA